MTNAVAFVKTYSSDPNVNTTVLYKILERNLYRGDNVALAINDKTTSGEDISSFKLDNNLKSSIAKAPSKNLNASSILGFFSEGLFDGKKIQNVEQLGNVYYLAVEGSITNKEAISNLYNFDLKLSTTAFLINYFKMNFQLFNNPKDAILETIKNLEGSYSIILYINPISTVFWYTTTSLFYRSDETKFIISSEPLDNFTKCDNFVLYSNNVAYNIVNRVVPNYKSDTVYTCVFDNTIESVVLMYAIKSVFNPNKINVVCSYKNYLDLQYALQDDPVFNVVRTNISSLGELPAEDFDVSVDSINVDSQYRHISEIYDLQYRSSADSPRMKYYPMFQYLRITDIVKLGLFLKVPFGKFKLCESTQFQYYSNESDRLVYNCGTCKTCIRTKSIFDKLGIDITDNIIPYIDHKIVDNLKVKHCENLDINELNETWFNSVKNLMLKDLNTYVG